MVTSDFSPEVEIRLVCACAMIMDVAMGQIPRSTEHISSFNTT